MGNTPTKVKMLQPKTLHPLVESWNMLDDSEIFRMRKSSEVQQLLLTHSSLDTQTTMIELEKSDWTYLNVDSGDAIRFFLFAHKALIYAPGCTVEPYYCGFQEHAVNPDEQDKEKQSFFCTMPQGIVRGVHFNKRLVFVFVVRTQQESALFFVTKTAPDAMGVLIDFHRQVQLFHDECVMKKPDNSLQKVTIYAFEGSAWSAKKRSSIQSLLLPTKDKKMVTEDLQQFVKNQARYQKLGIPAKRGYLFYGPPGCGKTTSLGAFASLIKHDLAYLSLVDLDDASLTQAVHSLPNNCILVLEDLDRMKLVRRASEKQLSMCLDTKVTMSVLLNVLDGVNTPDSEFIVFATTNHKDQLDEALIRPGRVDVQLEFSWATVEQAHDMFLLYFPDAPLEEAKEMCREYPKPGTHNITLATLASYFKTVMHLDPKTDKIRPNWSTLNTKVVEDNVMVM
jgi:hypothetical protein